MPLRKSHLIDKTPWWAAALIGVGFVISFFICVGVGINGPGSFLSLGAPVALLPSSSLNCSTPASCTVSAAMSFGGLSGYNQLLWVGAQIQRPLDKSTGTYALAGASFQVPVEFQVDAFGTNADGSVSVLAANSTMSAMVQCLPLTSPAGGGGPGNAVNNSWGGNGACSMTRVFIQPFLFSTQYTITVRVINPWSGFIAAGVAAANINTTAPVGLNMFAVTLNPAFTRFQIGSKYTFLALSIIMLAIFLFFVCCGRGSRSPRNPSLRLPFTSEQLWIAILGGMLCWANDPFAAVSLTTPSFAASGFYAVCAATFLVTLLVYWLVAFDNARDPAISGVAAHAHPLGSSAQLARRCHCSAVTAAILYWLPKLLWGIVSWVLLVSYYIIQRAASIADPTTNVLAAVPLVQQYFTSFLMGWGGLYVLYLGVMFILAIYQCRIIAPASRFILAITFITLLAVLVGYFMQGSLVALSASANSAVYMAAQGAPNVYIYFLMIAYLPALPHSVADADAADVADKAAGPGQELAEYGGVGRGTLTIDAAVQTEDDVASAGGESASFLSSTGSARRQQQQPTAPPAASSSAVDVDAVHMEEGGVAHEGAHPFSVVAAVPSSAGIVPHVDEEEDEAGGSDAAAEGDVNWK